jgi:hypothetical protein
MKYQINKSRLDELVMYYLDEVFSGIEEHLDDEPEEIIQWWGVGDERVLEVENTDDEEELVMGVSFSIWDGVENMFSLTHTQVEEYMLMWIQTRLGLYPTELFYF